MFLVKEFEEIVIESIDHKFHVTIASLKLIFKNSFVLKEMFKFPINNRQIFFECFTQFNISYVILVLQF